MFWMRAYPLRGEVGGGWALEFSSFWALWNGIEPIGKFHLGPGAFLYVPVPFSSLLISNKFCNWGGGGSSAVMLVNRTRGVVWYRPWNLPNMVPLYTATLRHLRTSLSQGGRRFQQRPQQRCDGPCHGPAAGPRRYIPHPHCVGRESGGHPAPPTPARCQHQSPASRRQIPGESPFFLLCSRSGYVSVHLVFFGYHKDISSILADQ